MIGILSALLFAAQPAAAAPEPCTEDEAIVTTVVEIASDPDRFLDRCVTVSGPVAGVSMFSGREGMYLVGRLRSDGNPTPEARLHRIGIDRQDIRNSSMPYPRQTTVTGRVDSCERRFDRVVAAGGIPFLGGYCHYHDGPTIVVDSYSIAEKRFERMTGEAARARFGDLAFMPADWPTRREVEGTIAEFLAALRAGNRAKLAELHEFKNEDSQFQQYVLDTLLNSSDGGLAQLRSGEPMQAAYFLLAAEDGTPFELFKERPGGTVCFCRASDCSGRWPISLNDIAGAPGRPYVCTRVEARDYPPRRTVLSTQVNEGWLTEPAATAVP